MRREPALTFQGALRILGHAGTPGVDRLDTALGGTILAAGAVTGLSVAGIGGLVPATALGALWGWVDQKNEATGLLRKLVTTLGPKIGETGGMERRQLVAAAHTTVVAAAFFEVLREESGGARLSAEEQSRLLAGDTRSTGFNLLTHLYSSEVPAPSAARGFTETVPHVAAWLQKLARHTHTYVSGLTAFVDYDISWLQEKAVERYRTHYTALCAQVAEFRIWSDLLEHAATRARVDDLLGQLNARLAAPTDLGRVVHRANLGRIREPILAAEPPGTGILLPAVEHLYISPRYRLAAAGAGSRVADETWWQRVPAQDDLDFRLLAHLLSMDATRLPLLVLGHPGAGKSMLTKMLAAQLPQQDYTVVRVPLRAVSAQAPVLDQIQEGLDRLTHRRVDWPELAGQTAHTLRVVLLDGLDELLQASGADRSAYLREVADFQRRLLCVTLDTTGGWAVPPDWRSTVALWESGLDTDGWYAMLGTLRRAGDSLLLAERVTAVIQPVVGMLLRAFLTGDRDAAARLDVGAIVYDDLSFTGTSWYSTMLSWLVPGLLGRPAGPDPTRGAAEIGAAEGFEVMGMAKRLLALGVEEPHDVADLVRFVLDHRQYGPYGVTRALGMAVCRAPALLDRFEELCEPRFWDSFPAMPALMAAVEPEPESDAWRQLRKALTGARPTDPGIAVRSLLEPFPLLLDDGG